MVDLGMVGEPAQGTTDHVAPTWVASKKENVHVRPRPVVARLTSEISETL